MDTTNKHIILFDGDCNFCNFWVKFVIKRDRKDQFRFASLQSERGVELLGQYQLKADLSTVVFIKSGSAYTKSSAALCIAQSLGGILSTSIVFWVVPKLIRDFVYDVVAKNRKKLLKNESCIIPDSALRTKFLS